MSQPMEMKVPPVELKMHLPMPLPSKENLRCPHEEDEAHDYVPLLGLPVVLLLSGMGSLRPGKILFNPGLHNVEVALPLRGYVVPRKGVDGYPP